MDRNRTGPLDWLVIGLPVLLGAALCAYHLPDRSLWLDEGASYSIASQHGSALWQGIAHDGGNMLIYYVALHVVIAIFGDGEIAIRMISLLADAATAGLVAVLALRLFDNRRVALVAGVLSAVSVGLIFWGQDARGYAVMVTFTAASFLMLVLLLETPPERNPPLWAVGGYILCTAMALYIGFDAILVVPAQLLLAWVLGRRLRTVIVALAIVAVLCVPLLVLAINRGSGQLFWVPPISGTVLWDTLVTLVSSGLPPNFHITWVTVICTVAGTGVTLAAIVVAWRSRWGGGRTSLVVVPLAWLVVPAVLGVVAYAVGEPIELARISILLMPALALLVAWLLVGSPGERGLAGGDRWAVRGVGAAGIAGLIIVLGLRVAVLVPSYGETPEPWKLVATKVLAQAQPRDCLAFYPLDGRMPFGYYIEHTRGALAKVPRPILPVQLWSQIKPHVEQYELPPNGEMTSLTAGCKRVWLLESHQGQAGGTAQSRKNYNGAQQIQQELGLIYSGAQKWSYGWASPVNVYLYSR